MKTKHSPDPAPQTAAPQWLEVVRSRVGGLRFGVVQIVVHDGRVTQVESTERVRLPAEPAAVDA